MDIVEKVLKYVMKSKGYAWFDGHKPYNVNIVGVRSGSLNAGAFDDSLYIVYRDKSLRLKSKKYQITTDIGKYYLKHENKLNRKGGAILVPNQYRSVYKIDTHNGKYEALCQRLGNVCVYRDNDGDDRLDMDPDTIDCGRFGINIHKSSKYNSENREGEIGKYSAGCQVFKIDSEFNEFMEILRKAEKVWGNKFSYTLLEEKDFNL
tara:strand:+ start:613 stop:1230 length:618 start_codon:yes stop_codon:yes gene_type:complete